MSKIPKISVQIDRREEFFKNSDGTFIGVRMNSYWNSYWNSYRNSYRNSYWNSIWNSIWNIHGILLRIVKEFQLEKTDGFFIFSLLVFLKRFNMLIHLSRDHMVSFWLLWAPLYDVMVLLQILSQWQYCSNVPTNPITVTRIFPIGQWNKFK